MDINVAQLLKSHVGAMREYDLEPGERVALDDDMIARVESGHVRLDRTNSGILARGSATASVNAACARCLNPVDVRQRIDFSVEYEPSIDIDSGKPLPAPENEMVFVISPNHLLDLGEALRQNILAALPISPLCRPDCAGLCPSCGANRNDEPCDCTVDGEHHPLAALAALLDRKEMPAE